MRRRRLLTGLSAASVAAALPSFAFGGRARADDEDELRLTSRLRRGPMGEEGREFRLMVRSSVAVTLPQALRIEDSYVLYPDGSRGVLGVAVESAHPAPRSARRRRVPPPLPPIDLSPQRAVHVATLSLRARNSRRIRGEAHIEVSLAGTRFVLPVVRFMA